MTELKGTLAPDQPERVSDEVYAELAEGFEAANDRWNADAKQDFERNQLLAMFTDTVEKRRNYHEVHPDGCTCRGQIGDVKYEQVLVNGKATFTVAVQDNLIGMFYTSDCWAIVDLHTQSIVQGKSMGLFAEYCREGYDSSDREYKIDSGELIVLTAQMESDCPRWGMSW